MVTIHCRMPLVLDAEVKKNAAPVVSCVVSMTFGTFPRRIGLSLKRVLFVCYIVGGCRCILILDTYRGVCGKYENIFSNHLI